MRKEETEGGKERKRTKAGTCSSGKFYLRPMWEGEGRALNYHFM